MTHTSTEQPEALLPCPFCGGVAHFDVDDENWGWVECSGCGIQGNRSASLMEDCKPKLAEAWNRRTPASQAQRAPLTDEEKQNLLKEWSYSQFTGKGDFLDGVDAAERAHGITQEKQ